MTRFRNALIVCCLLLLSTTGAQSATIQDFDVAGTPYSLTNHYGAVASIQSEVSNNFFRLAYSTYGTTLNSIAFNQTDSGIFTSITAEFDFRMGGGSRADGLSFALLPMATWGASGGGPGISEEANVAGAFGVGFDIYNNGFSNNHISLHWNGSAVLQQHIPLTTLDLAGNVWLHTQIVLDFEATGANVSVNVGGKPLIEDYFISGLVSYESRVAFGARTGGATANHDIDNVNLQYTRASVVPVPSTLALLIPGLLAIIGRRVKK